MRETGTNSGRSLGSHSGGGETRGGSGERECSITSVSTAYGAGAAGILATQMEGGRRMRNSTVCQGAPDVGVQGGR